MSPRIWLIPAIAMFALYGCQKSTSSDMAPRSDSPAAAPATPPSSDQPAPLPPPSTEPTPGTAPSTPQDQSSAPPTPPSDNSNQNR
jgi:hypothetical protein